MQQENSRIHSESVLFVTEMKRFRPGSNWYDAAWSCSYLFTTWHWQFVITIISKHNLSKSPKTFEKNQISFLHSVKVIKQEGHVTLDHSPEHFQTLKAVLYVRTGYPVRSVAVRINPIQTLHIRTNPCLHRSKPFFIRSAHSLTRVVPYLTI